MRVIASGDHHFNSDSRFAETVRVHGWIAELVEHERPDAFLSGGDVFDRSSNPEERMAVADWLTRVAEVCPILIAVGNHDRPRECELMGRLKTRHQVTVEARCGVHRIGDAAIAAVAWPNRASLLAMIGNGSSGAADAAGQEALRAVLAGLGAELAQQQGPRILVMHAMVDGSKTSVGQPLVGVPMNVGIADLGLSNAQIGVLAHIHCPQEVAWNGATYLYTGSPYRTSFGECEEKSVVLAEVTATGCTWERVATPATKMLLAQDEWGADEQGRRGWLSGWGDIEAGGARGAEVRLRYDVDSDQRDVARAAAAEFADVLRRDGAVSVQVEEQVRATVTARAPEVAAAKTTADKLEALWRSRGFDPGDRRERLLGKLTEIEGGV